MKNILYQESIVEIKHLFRMMRNTLLALFVFAGTAFATESYSQTMKVTVVADNVSTGKVISEIEKQTDYLFVYNVNEVNLKRNVKVNAQNKSVAEVLNKVFEGTDIYYAMEGKNIMLMSKAKHGEVAQQANKVTGIERCEWRAGNRCQCNSERSVNRYDNRYRWAVCVGCPERCRFTDYVYRVCFSRSESFWKERT